MATGNADTQMIINRAETQIKSLTRSPAGAAGRSASDLERTVKKLHDILQTAWTYCGSHPTNDVAFARYQEVLDVYVRAGVAISEYRSRRPTYGDVS